MQFVINGPDIPDALLQAHEDGRVVFFCGAGVSYPAGLPGFKGLVDQIYTRVGTTRSEIEEEAYKRSQFDATLDLLERRIAGGRLAVRTALAEALRPNLRRKGATETHESLLQLSRCRDGALRLVTTNFDRVFEHVAKRSKQPCTAYPAPTLPIPKNSRWNGLVYLHGLLTVKPDDAALNRLVVTSGDFGLAYLTERWAARFVSELFRNYVVCFVGYSINDPVLRYMMDALAADRMLGEITPQAYALGDYAPGQERAKTVEWQAKGVTPILYEVGAGTHNHSGLHTTLKAWAATYRDGILGKERIVVEHALVRPSASTRQDHFVGRMLWALSDDTGLPAKRFADLNPVPSLDWLTALSDDRFLHGDLSRFGVTLRAAVDPKLKFSLVSRPAPYSHSPWMTLVGNPADTGWDDVMYHIARWLTRHLNDPQLIWWVIARGTQPNERWARMVERKLNEVADLEHEGKVAELEAIRAMAPNSIPIPLMRTLWRLLLTGRVKSPWRDPDFYRWQGRLKREGLTATLRMELRDLLAPVLRLKKPYQWSDAGPAPESPPRLEQLVDWELVLAADSVRAALRDVARDTEDDRWHRALPSLLPDFESLLRDALDLLRELGKSSYGSDRSHWDLPSITPHWQNRGFRDWVLLIELVRDAWLAVLAIDAAHATRIALQWFDVPYPTFKRLAFFAASQDGVIAPDRWIEWLLSDAAYWLWSVDAHREVMRLFVLQGARLSTSAQERLETGILAGPPRDLFRDDADPAEMRRYTDHKVWLRLAKLESAELQLGAVARDRLLELSAAYPQWQLDTHERDEFLHWMSGTGDPDFEDSREINIAPRARAELVLWLKQSLAAASWNYEDTWRDVCRAEFALCLLALTDLAEEGRWPIERWQVALQVWSEDALVLQSWQESAPLVATMPDTVLQALANNVSWWLEAASKSIERHEAVLLDLCRRVLLLSLDSESGITQNAEPIHRPVSEAVNHPVGHVTQALLHFWVKRGPSDNDRLSAEIDTLFTQLCDLNVNRFRHGRVLLASRLIALFRVDREWTERHLLPLFDWTNLPDEARSVWSGFLWSPRLYGPLLVALKSQFLDTANHFAELGEQSSQFVAFLTYAALEPVDGYSSQDFRSAFAVLTVDALELAAQALTRALGASVEQREDYWKHRIAPFWQTVWPKSRELATNRIAESVARLCIAAGGEFPSALTAVEAWLMPIERPYGAIHSLLDSGLCSRFPLECLRLLNAVVSEQHWAHDELRKCLEVILREAPEVESDPRYRRLDILAQL